MTELKQPLDDLQDQESEELRHPQHLLEAAGVVADPPPRPHPPLHTMTVEQPKQDAFFRMQFPAVAAVHAPRLTGS
ncbi:hypothetical protein [Azospirillum doebereinerae]|uniref:Uncharacterized protein n=1 Tax=Azospirillum doebereinerae TaxID=92933 RepID=A0A433J2H3_9PROT|nr:hypothetical protein [Azospirillum doebereinerae]MCG5243045.1 hypothetical protein [Azospirillum doebereinerae]RUQ65896.1 hypothetical protein EJ913_24800 [Azospirillum doebereinerae]